MFRAISLIAMLGLAACAPKVQHANSAGGVIGLNGVMNEQSKAAAVADAECAKHGKIARLTRQDVLSDTVNYECVAQR